MLFLVAKALVMRQREDLFLPVDEDAPLRLSRVIVPKIETEIGLLGKRVFDRVTDMLISVRSEEIPPP